MHRDEWIWLAGFLDGEGTFTINRGIRTNGKTNKIYNRLEARIAVSGNDKNVIENLCKEFNKNMRVRQQINPLYTLEVHDFDTIIYIIENILPYLKVKKRQAEILLSFAIIRREVLNKRPPYGEKEFELYNEIKKLNQRGRHTFITT